MTDVAAAPGPEPGANSVSEKVRALYDNYYGDDGLACWRRVGAVDKSRNIVDLCSGLNVKSVLEIGCGDGAVIAKLSELGFAPNFHGVDISASAIAEAKRQCRNSATTFSVFDGAILNFAPEQFDVAVLTHIVEHLEHPRALLYAARRVARHVFVEVPCEHTLSLAYNYRPDPTGHINYYTPKTIRHLLQSCGMTVKKQVTRGSSLSTLRYAEPRLAWLRHSLREVALRVAPQIATSIFTYHSALLCE